MIKVPFVDLKIQYEYLKREVYSAIDNVFESSQFILGPEVEAFEKEFANYCNVEFAIGVNSGTSAIHLALLAAGIKPNDEVITVPFTFVATIAAILYVGAKPIFVDIEKESFNLDVKNIEKVITNKTKAIIPVHLYGQPVEMDSTIDLAKKYKLIVIEDAAQAHGAEYKGRKVGSLGDLGCFSFYPGKNLGAYGEGGIVTTNNNEYSKTIKMLRDWGQEKKYNHVLKGYNYRMEGIQGAILRVKLRYLEKWIEARRNNAKLYNELLSGCNLETPKEMIYARHVYHIYAIRTKKRDILQKYLLENNIQTGIHYPIPVHLQKAYSELGYKIKDFPISEKTANEVLSLPMFPELTKFQIEYVASTLKEKT